MEIGTQQTMSFTRAGTGSVWSLLWLQGLAQNRHSVNIYLINDQAHPFPHGPMASLGD